jgi:hypothetical protein
MQIPYHIVSKSQVRFESLAHLFPKSLLFALNPTMVYNRAVYPLPPEEEVKR